MRITVVGGTGRIGSKVVDQLRDRAHSVSVASRRLGVDTITREGLQEAVNGSEVVVDLVESHTVEEGPARWFFATSTQHLLAAERRAGVRHHVCLSIVGTQRISGGYFGAKLAQEDRIRSSGVPFTILRSTQVLESLGTVADDATDGRLVRLAPLRVQPVALADLATALVDHASGTPLNATVMIAGPEQLDLSAAVQCVLTARHDLRRVVPDSHTFYRGSELGSGDTSLLPELQIATSRFEDWLLSVNGDTPTRRRSSISPQAEDAPTRCLHSPAANATCSR